MNNFLHLFLSVKAHLSGTKFGQTALSKGKLQQNYNVDVYEDKYI